MASNPEAEAEPVDPSEFDDLPSTDIETELCIHFGMAGSFPLRLADLFFANDGLHIVEYSYITPMFGLGAKKHRREAKAMQSVYDVHGLDEVLLQGDSVYWYNYDAIDRVVLSRGGSFSRPKLTVYPAAESAVSHAYRLHELDDADALASSLHDIAADRSFEVRVESGARFRPRENVRRFFR
ncbi:hypothetical protein [Haloplanus halobius]|uniref:hypothetical protein n=1 Tax=Haloplanus halobius TaxID=2934938 RepID=UPI00200E3C35|nr:hypothetical protein [Haloplanus sp. XH21]